MNLHTSDNWRCALVQDTEPWWPGVAPEDQHDGDVPPAGRHQVSTSTSVFSDPIFLLSVVTTSLTHISIIPESNLHNSILLIICIQPECDYNYSSLILIATANIKLPTIKAWFIDADCIIVCIALSQVRCQVQELRVVLLQEGSAAEDDIPEVQLQLARVRDKYFILTTAINISPQIFSGNK